MTRFQWRWVYIDGQHMGSFLIDFSCLRSLPLSPVASNGFKIFVDIVMRFYWEEDLIHLDRLSARETTSVTSWLLSLLKRGLLWKDRICSLREQILFFQNRPLLGSGYKFDSVPFPFRQRVTFVAVPEVSSSPSSRRVVLLAVERIHIEK